VNGAVLLLNDKDYRRQLRILHVDQSAGEIRMVVVMLLPPMLPVPIRRETQMCS